MVWILSREVMPLTPMNPAVHRIYIPSFWRARKIQCNISPFAKAKWWAFKSKPFHVFTQVARVLSFSFSLSSPLSFDRHSKTQQHNDEPYYFIGAKWSLVVKAARSLAHSTRTKRRVAGRRVLFSKVIHSSFMAFRWLRRPMNGITESERVVGRMPSACAWLRAERRTPLLSPHILL